MWAECQGSAVVMPLVVSVPKYKISEYPFMIISFGPLKGTFIGKDLFFINLYGTVVLHVSFESEWEHLCVF